MLGVFEMLRLKHHQHWVDNFLFHIVPYTGECKKGLCNSQTFTRSHCDCDARFRRCLQGLNTGLWLCFRFIRIFVLSHVSKFNQSETANTLGAVFFNVVQVTCFKERRPCSVHQRWVEFDNSFFEPEKCFCFCFENFICLVIETIVHGTTFHPICMYRHRFWISKMKFFRISFHHNIDHSTVMWTDSVRLAFIIRKRKFD